MINQFTSCRNKKVMSDHSKELDNSRFGDKGKQFLGSFFFLRNLFF